MFDLLYTQGGGTRADERIHVERSAHGERGPMGLECGVRERGEGWGEGGKGLGGTVRG